jgi:hypothetical protein
VILGEARKQTFQHSERAAAVDKRRLEYVQILSDATSPPPLRARPELEASSAREPLSPLFDGP